jgi:hypothetical protein
MNECIWRNSNVGYIFLCGADMNPVGIRANPGYAGAKFIGIGSVAAETFPGLAALDGRVWGILLESNAATGSPGIEVIDRQGKTLRATLGTGAADIADVDAVIAEARYWELPVAYWRGLS